MARIVRWDQPIRRGPGDGNVVWNFPRVRPALRLMPEAAARPAVTAAPGAPWPVDQMAKRLAPSAAAGTLQTMTRTLRALERFAGEVAPEHLTLAVAAVWEADMTSAGLSRTTIQNRMRTVHRWVQLVAEDAGRTPLRVGDFARSSELLDPGALSLPADSREPIGWSCTYCAHEWMASPRSRLAAAVDAPRGYRRAIDSFEVLLPVDGRVCPKCEASLIEQAECAGEGERAIATYRRSAQRLLEFLDGRAGREICWDEFSEGLLARVGERNWRVESQEQTCIERMVVKVLGVRKPATRPTDDRLNLIHYDPSLDLRGLSGESQVFVVAGHPACVTGAHVYGMTVGQLVKEDRPCPGCSHDIFDPSQSHGRNAEVVSRWEPALNDGRMPWEIHVMDRAWLRCDQGHVYEMRGTRPLVCSDQRHDSEEGQWLRVVLRALGDRLHELAPMDLMALAVDHPEARDVLAAVAAGRFSRTSLEEFLAGESVLSQFKGSGGREGGPARGRPRSGGRQDRDAAVGSVASAVAAARTALAFSPSGVARHFEEQAVKKILLHFERDAATAAREMAAEAGRDEFGARMAREVNAWMVRAAAVTLPEGYDLSVDGRPVNPNLMQRLVPLYLKDRGRFLNLSTTGAGKTLSVLLAAHHNERWVVVIFCPLGTVSGYQRLIASVDPQAEVVVGSLADMVALPATERRRYLIINFDKLQCDSAARHADRMALEMGVDMVVVDEIHLAKARSAREVSRRRQHIGRLIRSAGAVREDLHVLGMSATPVINELAEGYSLLDLVFGEARAPQVGHGQDGAARLHRVLCANSIRYRPILPGSLATRRVVARLPVMAHLAEELVDAAGMVGIESALTQYKLDAVDADIRPGTVLYVHYVGGDIQAQIEGHLERRGLSFGHYTGADKSGLDAYLDGNADVLILSSAGGTGLDGLQARCDRLVVLSAPWTHAALEQLVGRVYRQGQRSAEVEVLEVVVELVSESGRTWSLDADRYNLLENKRTLGEAAVDGVLPDQGLAQAELVRQSVSALRSIIPAAQLAA